MEMAGASHLHYDARILPLRLTCLGRISAGIILKAFEQGALGVLLLGCPPETCQYESGFAHAEEVVAQTRKFLDLLGHSPERLRLQSLTAETGQSFADTVNAFIGNLDALEPGPNKAMEIPATS